MTEKSIIIRKAIINDIRKIAELEAECFNDASSENARASLFGMGAFGVIAFVDDCPCGIAYAADCAGDAELLRICVKREYRKFGIGRELIKTLHSVLKSAGMESVFLEVRESNSAAISLYSSEGYVITGKRKGFYKAPTEDALLFTKKL